MENQKPPSPPVFEMRIVMTGEQLSVNGPIHNKVLALGMLAAAQDCILDFHRKQASPTVLAPVPAVSAPPFPNGLMNGGHA